MRSSVLKHGVYTLGNPPETTYIRGVGGVPGRMGSCPLQYLGAFDLKPWQGAPPGWSGGVTPTVDPLLPPELLNVADEFREEFFAVDSGDACVRFTSRRDYPPIGVNTLPGGITPTGVMGGYTLKPVWFNEQIFGATPGRTATSMPLLIASADSLTEMEAIWQTVLALGWGAFGASGFNVPRVLNAWTPLGQFPCTSLSVGPDVLSDLAHSGVAEYDLRELGQGARFVAAWTGAVWVGAGPNFWLDSRLPMRFRWQLEDRPARRAGAPMTYSYPVDQVAPNGGALGPPLQTPFIGAQWSARTHGTAVSGQPPWSVSVANGGEQIQVDIAHAVGQQVDRLASAPQLVAPAVSNRACSITRLIQSPTAQFPYSYGFLAMESLLATATGPAIVSVTVA